MIPTTPVGRCSANRQAAATTASRTRWPEPKIPFEYGDDVVKLSFSAATHADRAAASSTPSSPPRLLPKISIEYLSRAARAMNSRREARRRERRLHLRIRLTRHCGRTKGERSWPCPVRARPRSILRCRSLVQGESFFALRMTGYEHLGQLPGTPSSSPHPRWRIRVEFDCRPAGKPAGIKIEHKIQPASSPATSCPPRASRTGAAPPTSRDPPGLWFATQRRNSRVFQENPSGDRDGCWPTTPVTTAMEARQRGRLPQLDYSSIRGDRLRLHHRLMEEAGIYHT